MLIELCAPGLERRVEPTRGEGGGGRWEVGNGASAAAAVCLLDAG